MSSNSLKSAWPYLLCALILVIICSVYFGYIIDSKPMGVHEWAQADRLAIAYRFFDDGMNFFHPATYNLIPRDGVVGVEFPIQAYLAASFAHVFGRSTISICFRLLDIAIMYCGLMFLFHTVYKRTKDFLIAMVPVMFVACLPTYLYYTGNYLPDPASVSLTFIGFSFLFDYFDNNDKQRPLFIALLWLTLAAMIKTTAITYLTVVIAFVFFSRLKKYRSFKSVLPIITASVICFALEVANLAVMQYLHITYDSWLFTTTVHPFESWDKFNSFIENNYKVYWMTEYFTLPQYTLYILLVVAGARLGFLYNGQKLGWLMLPFLICALFFGYLFGAQLNVHDYYVLAIFFPLLIFALILSVITLHKRMKESPPELYKSLRLALAVTALILFFFTDHQLYQRNMSVERYWSSDYAYTWMIGGDKTLDSLHIPRSEHIVALDENSPNLGLVYFDRRGYNLDKGRWNGDPRFAVKWMKERNINLAVCNEWTVRRLMNDSSFNNRFNVLSLGNNKGVIRIKPGI